MDVEDLKQQLEQFDGDEELLIEDSSGNDHEIDHIHWHQGYARIKLKNS